MSLSASAFRRAAGQGARAGAARLLAGTGLPAWSRRRQQGLRILMYHGLMRGLRGPAAFGHLFVDEEVFARHMRHLRRAFDPVSLEEVARAWDAGETLPPCAVAVTFDDGYATVLTLALPILARERVPATVFVCAGLAGPGACHWFDALRLAVAHAATARVAIELGHGLRIDGRAIGDAEGAFAALSSQFDVLAPEAADAVTLHLEELVRARGLLEQHPELHLADWPQWRAAADGPWLTTGSHAMRHSDLTRRAPEACAEELRASREGIERAISRPCRFLAYPHGRWTPALADAADRAGYTLAVTTDDGLNTPAQPRLALRRTMIGDKGDVAVFRARVSGAWDAVRRSRPRAPAAREAA